ncbi:CheB methylesterase [Filimonas lacunae]|uniref:protein-glutamate methylesterase n=1 Tax=Filimonas lacunae TaxID=477680 RepID=A0A173MEZ7_9BACT|nr:chemotaxis protein CheB [Filimonas lacunae]BAV06087.1 chemotaxis protein-glutamate methylesterase [Filimonas lacunae]SIT24593.1 CheB methylesterase [Filimonas lacunae]
MEENRITRGSGLVVVGGSAGSLDVILKVLPLLSERLLIPVIIVLHRKTSDDNILVELLAAKTKLPVKEVEDGDIITPGIVYVAPADYHLLIEKNGGLSLDASEKINYSRPSIDATFESAALAYNTQLTAVILSGGNGDGTEGLKAVKEHKGVAIAQDPSTATAPYMPQFAITAIPMDAILDAEGLAEYINQFS